MSSSSVAQTERKRYVMHISSPEGHEHMVSPLTSESPKEILEGLFSEADGIEIKENGAQGDGFFIRIEPLADYIAILPEGEDKDYYVRELARPGWADSKIGKILYKTLCALGIIRIY